MDDEVADGGSLLPTLGAVVVSFVGITLLSGTLLGYNWTQAVLLGGFGGAVAAASAAVTARRSSNE